jgi:FAD/FMN-containing dehydrogenase
MTLLSQLFERLGPDVVQGPPDIDASYMGDWIRKADAGVQAAALVRPRTTAQVSEALKICHELGVSVVPQGGRTGLAGGAMPGPGWIILALERMRGIEAIDVVGATITVLAGTPLQVVQEAADAADMLFPLDIGSRGSCTIGGNIATNAGGNRVLRYGMMRELVLGLEVVSADGTILESLNTMLKNNAGYDLKQLFIGSEGTLGVVTRAVLRLFPKPRSVNTAMCAVGDYGCAQQFLQHAKSGLGEALAAFEVMWPDFYHLATTASQRRAPLPHGAAAYILIESMGVAEVSDAAIFTSVIESALEQGLISDAVVAQSRRESAELWSIRDASGEFQKTFWPFLSFDVSLPITSIGEFVADCAQRLRQRWPDIGLVNFGHIADSNVHVCVKPGAAPLPEREVDEVVYQVVRDYRGSVSAEHGIGVLKRAYLGHTRNPAELALMRVLKSSLDPKGILNPGKIFKQGSGP